MPTQLSTILYISNYKESTTPNLFIGSTTGIIRLNENDLIQTFNMTIFYPINPSTPSYIPKLTNGQVLSVNNCKFSLENNNEIDNIRSQTIYSTLRIREMQNKSQTLAFYDYEFFKNLQHIDTIIIDEISMISAALLNFISDVIVALTVHKTQGLTLSKVSLFLDNQIFSTGQAYVTLNRSSNWSNVYIATLNPSAFITDQSMIEEYE